MVVVTAVRHHLLMTKQMFESNGGAAHGIWTSPVRRRHRVEVARWALANGVAIRRDSLSVIVATRDIGVDDTICTTWTCETVSQLLGWRSDAWCNNHRVRRPSLLEESLIGYLQYLRATRLLSDRSDRFEDLLAEIHDVTGTTDRLARLPVDIGSVHSMTTPWSVDGVDDGDATGRLIQLRPKKSSISASPS